jgi:hypothetical protein
MRALNSIAAVASCAVAVAAHASMVDRLPCKERDVKGIWQNVALTETPPGQLTEAFKTLPYEYFIFDGSGGFAYRAQATPAQVDGDDKMAAFANQAIADAKRAGKFNERVDHGNLVLLRDDVPWSTLKCFVSQADEDVVKTGDMVWYSLDGVTPKVKRVERRISRPS